jgi:hypothetical protein
MHSATDPAVLKITQKVTAIIATPDTRKLNAFQKRNLKASVSSLVMCISTNSSVLSMKSI